jgi:hypothetical protein
VIVHRGRGRGNFTADCVIKVGGLSDYPSFIDLDGNGTLDAFLAKVDTTLVKKAVDAGIFGDFSLDYEVFEFTGGSKLYEGPVYTRTCRVPVRDLEKRSLASVPLAFIPGDLSGDGRPDLLMLQPENRLEVFRGRVEYRAGGVPTIGFEKDVWAFHVLQEYPKSVQSFDLNQDGLGDILLQHAGSVGILMTRKR